MWGNILSHIGVHHTTVRVVGGIAHSFFEAAVEGFS
jgi:hypothetical protein